MHSSRNGSISAHCSSPFLFLLSFDFTATLIDIIFQWVRACVPGKLSFTFGFTLQYCYCKILIFYDSSEQVISQSFSVVIQRAVVSCCHKNSRISLTHFRQLHTRTHAPTEPSFHLYCDHHHQHEKLLLFLAVCLSFFSLSLFLSISIPIYPVPYSFESFKTVECFICEFWLVLSSRSSFLILLLLLLDKLGLYLWCFRLPSPSL